MSADGDELLEVFDATRAALVKFIHSGRNNLTAEELELVQAVMRPGLWKPMISTKRQSNAKPMVVVGGRLVDDGIIDWGEDDPPSPPARQEVQRGIIHTMEENIMTESARVDVTVLLTVGDQAELVTPSHPADAPLRVPAVGIAAETGVPVEKLPGKRFTAVVDAAAGTARHFRTI